ncbi:fluconazole resistance protein 3 [Diplogelasinospora grovesii]|uniref:Fluconazole resistance protein 3 n=1 Tax=Diplogelasinospora grovesii TaxID=303347 RepID=A0AAN6NBC5_9PEZI|nr:fluconazole resistance protein 3 [Diplogelasinospora grovesii]
MDYTHTAYFTGAQPYQFMGIPPLTPSHSNSAASDDFNTTSPPEVYEQLPNGIPQEQFQSFDNYAPFNPQAAFPGPPTPPNQHPAVHGQPINGSAHHAHPGADVLIMTKSEAEDLAQNRRQGSNSEEDELTPAQSRRKAQNRAAQRAFRERKERHVKDLENRLQQLEEAQQQAATENERLKRDLQKMSTENEILRATSSMAAAAAGATATSPSGMSYASPTTTGPLSYNPTNFYSDVLQGHANKTPSHRVVTSDDGERLLAAGATWDFIINHDLYKQGLVNIGDVSARLKHLAKCDGQGPVFEERAIIAAIEQSRASGSDELL